MRGGGVKMTKKPLPDPCMAIDLWLFVICIKRKKKPQKNLPVPSLVFSMKHGMSTPFILILPGSAAMRNINCPLNIFNDGTFHVSTIMSCTSVV